MCCLDIEPLRMLFHVPIHSGYLGCFATAHAFSFCGLARRGCTGHGETREGNLGSGKCGMSVSINSPFLLSYCFFTLLSSLRVLRHSLHSLSLSAFFITLCVLHHSPYSSPPSTPDGTHVRNLASLERDSIYKHDEGETPGDRKCERNTYCPLIQEN